MKFSSPKNIFINIVYILFVLILFTEFVGSIINGFAKESWNITEFLINYQGGFVRRGLLGEIILFSHHTIGINPYILILTISILAYLALLCFFIVLFVKKGYTLFILPFVFFLGNPIINDFWVRKDVLLILFFISIIYCATKKSSRYLILVNFLLVTGLLIHESIGFFCFPILLLILITLKNSDNYGAKAIVLSLAQLTPSLLAFVSVLYYKGSQLVASKIWTSWKSVTFPIQAKDDHKIPAAIDGISWSLKKGLLFTYNTLLDFTDGIYAPLGWSVILLVVYYILTNTDKLNFRTFNYAPSKNFNRINISNVMLFQLLAVFPLFVLGWDYGRWVFFWVTSSFAITLLIPETKLSTIFPKTIFITSTKINHILDLLFSKSGVFLCCALIGFPLCTWGIIMSTDTSLIVIILKFISGIFRIVTSFIREIL